MADSFIMKIAKAFAHTLDKKQSDILKELGISDFSEKLPGDKTGGTGGTGGTGTPPAPTDPSASAPMTTIDQQKAIKLQAQQAELAGLSAAATGVINAEKTAIQTIGRNI